MKKKFISLAMSLAVMANIVASTPLVAYAANTEAITAGTYSATVNTATGESGSDASVFIVAIPQEITLNRTTYQTFKGTYEVGVKAVLASDKKVAVVPASTFDMTSSGGASHTYKASVSQEKNTWVSPLSSDGDNALTADPDNYVNTEGTITVNIPVVGSYSGQLGFEVSLK